ncbi:reverse transcriptase domain-containing protein [Tanacetum coccineum]
MNMLNRNCKMSFAKPEFLKKAQIANPRLYDIGCYNDNLALMLTPDSDETIRLDKERPSKLSDLIRPFDYDQLNNLYDLFVPQRETSAEQHYFPKTSKMSQTSSNNEFSKVSFRKQPTLLEKRMDESIPWDQKHSQISTGNSRGHHSASITGRKVYESGFFWPSIFKDAKDYVMRCDVCQRSGNISSRNDMPQNNIQLDDALWAFRTAYKTPTRCIPFRFIYGKACHLPVEIEHRAYWALKQCNMNLIAIAKKHFIELNELMELRDGACENTRIYKERTKKWHDFRLRGDKNFKVGDKVFLFNSRSKMHPGKLKSKWYGPNVVKALYPYGKVEITDKNGISFKVNGQRLKKYYNGNIITDEREVFEFEENMT